MIKRQQIENNISLIEEFILVYIESYLSKSKETWEFWEEINNINRCYIFGGFLVDFLKKKKSHRDIDIVLDELSPESVELIEKYNGIKNSFGGYKLKINNVQIDVWAVKDTWAIKKMNYLEFDLFSILPSTSFFNSTAIIYSISDKKLTYKDTFVSYIANGTLDILFEENPYPELCIVKSYQNYKEGASLSSSLKRYIERTSKNISDNLDWIQKRHYGSVRYSREEINDFLMKIKIESRKKPNSGPQKVSENQLILFDA